MGRAGVRRIERDRHVVDPAGAALLRNEEHVTRGVILIEELRERIARVGMCDGALTTREEFVGRVGVEREQVVDRAGDKVACFVELALVGRVQGVTQRFERSAERLTRVIQERDLAFVGVGGVAEHEIPRAREVGADHAGVDGQPGEAPLVRHGILAGLVVGEPGEVVRKVARVREQVLVELLDEAALLHDADHVVRGNDDVVARRTGRDDRLHCLVGVVDVHRGGDAELLGKAVELFGVDVLGPVVEREVTIDLADFAGSRCALAVAAAAPAGRTNQRQQHRRCDHFHVPGLHSAPLFGPLVRVVGWC